MNAIDREAFIHFARNERWGTCVDCPRTSDGSIFPEFCINTERYDHHLTVNDLVGAYKIRKIQDGN